MIKPKMALVNAAIPAMQSLDMNVFIEAQIGQRQSRMNRRTISQARVLLIAKQRRQQPAAMPAADHLATSAVRLASRVGPGSIPWSGTTAGWIPH
ncbi:hypothetical protein [Nevskia sp.]|uniref:hypothetical protein n=1 Tax=Nevskia sp. TaxID=1929292 RepID=UPI0025E2AC4D|nr:hypothetical protein [Nevskia sp.]